MAAPALIAKKANTERKSKYVFQLDTPFSTVSWPSISADAELTILALLNRLLCPIGNYRADHVERSKGKRAKKRKRTESKSSESTQSREVSDRPPSPEIAAHVLVGSASVVRYLEVICQGASTPSSAVDRINEPPATSKVLAIFVPLPNKPTVLQAHFPQLVAAASRKTAGSPAIKLVQLSQSSEEKLASALGLQRAGFVAILDGAPHVSPLLNFVREQVEDIKVAWLDEAKDAKYLPLKVNTVKTTVGVAKRIKKTEGQQNRQPAGPNGMV